MGILDAMATNPWKLKTSTAKYLVCHVCGGDTHWGKGKGSYLLCDKHNKWRTYFSLRFRHSSAE